MPKFKAKIPFAYENLIFNPSDKKPHDIDNDILVNSWAEVGYCEIVGKSEKKKVEVKTEAIDEPVEALIDEVIEKVEEVTEQPKTGEKTVIETPFDSMSYPQLKKAAKEANIKGYQNMSKDKLIELLKGE